MNRRRHFDRLVGLSFQAQREDRVEALVIWLLVEVKISDIEDEVAEGSG